MDPSKVRPSDKVPIHPDSLSSAQSTLHLLPTPIEAKIGSGSDATWQNRSPYPLLPHLPSSNILWIPRRISEDGSPASSATSTSLTAAAPPTQKMADQQKNLLLFMHLGVEGARIFSTHPGAETRNSSTYVDYVNAVKEQFQPRITPLKAAFDLQQQHQLPGESVDAFLCALRSLLADCDYADPTQHLLQQLVIGCNDKDLQKELLAMPHPTLDRCLAKMRATEMATKEATEMAP